MTARTTTPGVHGLIAATAFALVAALASCASQAPAPAARPPSALAMVAAIAADLRREVAEREVPPPRPGERARVQVLPVTFEQRLAEPFDAELYAAEVGRALASRGNVVCVQAGEAPGYRLRGRVHEPEQRGGAPRTTRFLVELLAIAGERVVLAATHDFVWETR